MSKRNQSRRDAVQTAPNVEVENMEVENEGSLIKHINKKLKITFRRDSQKQFWELIDNNEIVLCSGPAGTGKSFLAVAKALHLLCAETSKYKRILVIKPVVEAADEKLGALPGILDEKLAPYSYSTKILIEKLVGQRRTERLIEKKYIEFTALAYLRGVNIDNTILIFEEAQNATRIAMKTLLTRIGENCKFIINGDLEQRDRKFAKGDSDGLTFAIEKLSGIEGIGIHTFIDKDIVRNPIIGIILKRFNGDVTM